MRRPRSLDEMKAAMAGFETEEGVNKGLAYRPDPSDIFISPYSKCGTTWMQQIVHGLRSGGDMDFAEITEVVPWIELAHDIGIDIMAPQVAAPRAFKSHLGWDEIPKGGRYIVVLRDPVDAMLSFYRFFEGWFFEPGSIALDEFSDFYLTRPEGEDYWSHAKGWWGQRDNPDVLLFSFEQMKRDLPGTVKRVADFMGGYEDDRIELAARQAGFDFMKAHASQFDDNLLRRMRDPACGLPPGRVTGKVNKGEAGQGRAAITEEMRAKFAQRWDATMGQAFGLKTYEELEQQLRW